ncbi:DUF6471 domain-containing protein [Roseateles albus]|uniref:DUF6471 domain-containing protein n=1 Tax=Roseateles albus TaxID=2987525 RepID=A0ABT5KDN7_9BURK|nr:DUF6471 domain-containing protein [Roseateles albus]MDC8770926.1 DUF6471 domain-containing protein [Roseateles albus]
MKKIEASSELELGNSSESVDTKWSQEAQQIVRAMLVRRGCSLKKLSRLLEGVGVNIQAKALANKLNRGTFSFAFVLQVAKVLEVQSIDSYTVGESGKVSTRTDT